MKRLSLIAVFLLSAGTGVFATDAPQLTVTAKLDPSTTLPGIPVSFELTFQNRGQRPVEIPRIAQLRVTDQHGESYSPGGPPGLLTTFECPRELRANSAVTCSIPTDGSFQLPSFFNDGRLHQPGRYELQLAFADAFRTAESLNVPFPTPILSNTMLLVVLEPTGADAKVWEEMQKISKFGWHVSYALDARGQAFAQRVVTEYPTSTYAGWFAGTATPHEAEIERLRNWVDSHPDDDAVAARRQLRLAIMEDGVSRNWASNPKWLEYSNRAIARYRKLLRDRREEDIQRIARERLEDLQDYQQEHSARR